MKQNEYMNGRHHFWIHFCCGLVFGIVPGLLLGAGAFHSTGEIVTFTAIVALIVAYCCGRWGDEAWRCISELFFWLGW